jgi:DNA-binding beta-propeller fold protein YncE
MAIRMGGGKFTYEVLTDWVKLPERWTLGDVTDVSVDSKDRVYLLTRGDQGEDPLIILDRDGNFLSSWGKGIFNRPHGLTIGPDESRYIADDGDHTVKKFTQDGKLVFTLGTPGIPAPFHGGLPFNRPTKIALDPKTSDLYISDGYGNSRVHKYSPDGRHLFSWGEPGTDPGQFNIVHSVCTDPDGHVYVVDRENHRIQVFDSNGKFLTQWHNLHRPAGFHLNKGICYIGELPTSLRANKNFPNLGARISICNLKGERLARLGDILPGDEPHQFWAPHGIAEDSKGDLYVAEVSVNFIGRYMEPPRKKLRSFRKLVKIT